MPFNKETKPNQTIKKTVFVNLDNKFDLLMFE